jgi:D-3-phosphoglycerate dehydrogenase
MERKTVFVPGVLFGDAARAFEQSGIALDYALPERLRDWDGGPALRREREEAYAAAVRERLPEAHALCALGLDGQLPVSAELLDGAPRLEVVFVPSAGTDAIDVGAATARGIAVINAAGNNYVSVSEHAVALILSLTRMVAITDRKAHAERRWVSTVQAGGWPGVLRGKTVGVVGFGYIGREVARICTTAFGMRALAYDPYFHPTEAERQGVTLVADLTTLLAESDVVSINSPLTPATRHLIDADALAAMKPTAFLVNTSRGGTVDTEALTAALSEGRIAGAGLDVTEPEPLPDGHPLFSLDNAILTPHAAGAAPEMFARAGDMSAQDTLLALRGERPRNLVNPEVWPAFTARLARDR